VQLAATFTENVHATEPTWRLRYKCAVVQTDSPWGAVTIVRAGLAGVSRVLRRASRAESAWGFHGHENGSVAAKRQGATVLNINHGQRSLANI
jgi:hypothetical protein